MFRYSIDSFIASKQKEKALTLLEELMKYSTLKHCPEIEAEFDKNVRTYALLEELPPLSIQFDHPIVMPVIPWDHGGHSAKMDLKKAYDKLIKSWRDPIPFIEFSFPNDYKCPHGESYKHVYIFFMTEYKNYDEAKDSVLFYLQKLNKLKVFL